MTGCNVRFTDRSIEQAMVEGAKHSRLVVFNDTPKDQPASIERPTCYKKAADLRDRVNRPIVRNTLRLTVPYQDAAALRLE